MLRLDLEYYNMGGEERKCINLLRQIVGDKSFDTWICKDLPALMKQLRGGTCI
jgi:hypothetical protein